MNRKKYISEKQRRCAENEKEKSRNVWGRNKGKTGRESVILNIKNWSLEEEKGQEEEEGVKKT